MKTPEQILRQDKYKDLDNLVLICEAMEEYAQQSIAEHEQSNSDKFWFDKFNELYPDQVREILDAIYNVDSKEYLIPKEDKP